MLGKELVGTGNMEREAKYRKGRERKGSFREGEEGLRNYLINVGNMNHGPREAGQVKEREGGWRLSGEGGWKGLGRKLMGDETHE